MCFLNQFLMHDRRFKDWSLVFYFNYYVILVTKTKTTFNVVTKRPAGQGCSASPLLTFGAG